MFLCGTVQLLLASFPFSLSRYYPPQGLNFQFLLDQRFNPAGYCHVGNYLAGALNSGLPTTVVPDADAVTNERVQQTSFLTTAAASTVEA